MLGFHRKAPQQSDSFLGRAWCAIVERNEHLHKSERTCFTHLDCDWLCDSRVFGGQTSPTYQRWCCQHLACSQVLQLTTDLWHVVCDVYTWILNFRCLFFFLQNWQVLWERSTPLLVENQSWQSVKCGEAVDLALSNCFRNKTILRLNCFSGWSWKLNRNFSQSRTCVVLCFSCKVTRSWVPIWLLSTEIGAAYSLFGGKT